LLRFQDSGKLEEDMSTPKDIRKEKPKSVSDNVSLLQTMADTSWRMLIPSAVFVAGGLYGDLHWGTKPWLTLFSVFLGLAVSVILIKNQISKVKL
jgi:hypothetical protein